MSATMGVVTVVAATASRQSSIRGVFAVAWVLLTANLALARQGDGQYDALIRLVAVADTHGSTSFEYDPVGNRSAENYPNEIGAE